jgi:hypothetical protein
METRHRLAVALLTAAWLGGSAALAQTSGTPADCPKSTAAERIDGTVMNVDRQQGVLTLRGPDGATYKFQASPETLQGLKIGDRIDTRLRVPEKCRKSHT